MHDFGLVLNIKSIKHLCLRIGASEGELQYFRLNKVGNVHQFEKRKHNSHKIRTLSNPHKSYKSLLRRINTSLLRGTFPPGVFGGVVGKQVQDVAVLHAGKEAILSVDLKNFFPSITSGRIFSMFKRTGCSTDICGLLTDLVTFNGSLPQGFPTSTAIANWIAYDLDVDHLDYCQTHNICRTRWVDDITFSGRHDVVRECIPSLLGAIKHHGFNLSNKKTLFAPRKHFSKVLGLDVSTAVPRVPEAIVKKIQCILEECKDYGADFVQLAYDFNNKKPRSSLEGHVRHIEKFNPKDGKNLRVLLESIHWESGSGLG